MKEKEGKLDCWMNINTGSIFDRSEITQEDADGPDFCPVVPDGNGGWREWEVSDK